jgi:hypothetical protein
MAATATVMVSRKRFIMFLVSGVSLGNPQKIGNAGMLGKRAAIAWLRERLFARHPEWGEVASRPAL